MDTQSLIRGLSRDTAGAGRLDRRLAAGFALAAGLAALVWFILLGPRPDIAEAAATLRFPFKFVVTLALAASAALAWRAAARPGTSLAPAAAALLLAAPLLLAAGVIAELFAVPEGARMARLIGTNSTVCLTFIPLIGALPLAVLLAALRNGAPTRPTLAGAFCGLAAGGLAATFYAAHCIDDSPLFVAVWYTIAIGMLTLAGALAGRLVLRW